MNVLSKSILFVSAVFDLGCWTSQAAGQVIWPVGALNSNAATDLGNDFWPKAATDGAGNWVTVWSSYDDFGGTIGTDADIVVARSVDAGATWSAPAALNSNAGSDSGGDSIPHVTTDGAGVWVTVWHSSDDLAGTIDMDADILFARSTDNGLTWSAVGALNGNADSDSGVDFWPQVRTDGSGVWVAVWMSTDDFGGTIGTDADVVFARSTDGGVTWSAPAALNGNADTDSGHDLWPHLAPDGAGNWVAVWYSNDELDGTIDSDQDILFARSTDDGATWSSPAMLNSNAGADSGNDLSPKVTTDGAGNWVTVWDSNEDLGGAIGTDGDILFARSTDNGVTWGAPAVLNSNAGSDSGADFSPQLATDGAGHYVAVWQSLDDLGGMIGTDVDILFARSADDGATWNAPAALNSNAGSDSGSDGSLGLATDGAGNWIGVWVSLDDLGGTIGSDRDILVTRFVLGLTQVPADRDADGDVDGVDFSVFASCFNQAGNPPRTVGCDVDDRDALDFDDDDDIDGVDFSSFASCFNQAGNPPRTAGCPES